MDNRILASSDRRRLKRLLSVLMCLLLAAMMMPAGAVAQPQDDAGGEKALELKYKDGEQALSGVKFDLYQISDSQLEADNDSLENSDAGDLEQLAAHVQEQGAQPAYTGTTDENGQLLFPAVKAGIYLISGEGKAFDNVNYVPRKTLARVEDPAVADDGAGPEPLVISVGFDKEGTVSAAAVETGKPEETAQKDNAGTTGKSGSDANSDQNAGQDDENSTGAEYTKFSSDKISITVDKVWNHNGNPASDKPDKFTVKLSGTDGTTKEESVSGKDSLTFSDLAVTDKDGKSITYTITENAVTDYNTEMASGNKQTAEAIAKAEEAAAKANADSVIAAVKAATDNAITLTKDQAELLLTAVLTMDLSNLDTSLIIRAARTQNITLTEAQAQALLTAFKNIDLQQLDAAKAAAANASVTISDDRKSAKVDASKAAELNKPAEITITNTYQKSDSSTSGTATIVVKKKWLDQVHSEKNLPEVTINLLKNGQKYKTAKLNADSRWTCTFDNLPVEEDGKEILYTVTEDKLSNYATRMITGSDSTLSTLITALKQQVKTATKVELTDNQAQLILAAVLTMDLSAVETSNTANRTVYVSDTVYNNEQNNSRVYHYKKTQAGNNPHEMTEQAAIGLGLRACKDCNPDTANSSSVINNIIALGKQININLDTTSATALLNALKNVDLSALKNSEVSVKASSAKNTAAEVLVMNIYTVDSGATGTKTSSDSKLPQTGILWWPVPVLALLGIVFIGTGVHLRRRRQKVLPEKKE